MYTAEKEAASDGKLPSFLISSMLNGAYDDSIIAGDYAGEATSH